MGADGVGVRGGPFDRGAPERLCIETQGRALLASMVNAAVEEAMRLAPPAEPARGPSRAGERDEADGQAMNG
jgi:hypothetical protein